MNSELNVDFSGILQEAERFDKKLKEIDNTAQQLGHTLRNALGNLDFGGLKSLKDNIERLGESKISLKVVGAEELTKMSSIIDTLISQVEVFLKGGVSVFDSKALYSDNNNVLELSASLEKVDQKISKLKEAWKSIGTSEQLAASDELFKGFVSPTHKNGTEYKPESKTYQNAMREHLEAQARIAIEEKAILSESLNWAKMTEDEKAAYIQKKLNDIFKAEEQQAKRVRKEYSDTVNEMVSLMKQTDSLNKKNTDGSITPKINQLESRFAELNSKRVQLEQQYGEQVVDIAQKTNSKVLAIEANRILEKNKKEKEEREKWYSTSSGAMHKARMAESIGEKEDAMGYLKTAMKNTYSPELIDKLRDKYQELRIAVEEHKKALNGELSLQPTVRAEYMRLRKELDSVVESKEKLAKTQAYKSGDEVAKSDYNAMVAREEDIQAKLVQIRKNAQGQLDAVDREYESKRAQNRVKEYEKAEQQIANKQTVAPKNAALFDLEELQAKRDRAVAIIKDLEGQVRALNTQYQAALTERGAVRDSIGGISKDEISELQQQINQLGQAMQQVGAGAGHSWRQSIQPYIDAINQLKDKIAQIKAEEEQLFKTDGAKANSKVSQLDSQYDGLYKTINGLLDEVDNLDKEMQSKIAANKAVEEQINKITEWEVKIKELENDFTRLNAAGKAFDSDGKLTAEGEDLTNRKTQLEEELKLMQMNAAEAKRYSDSIIAQEQREAELAIQEEQRTTNAKIAEYERLVREKIRLEKEARAQAKAVSNESLPENVRNDARSTLNETITERNKVTDRLIELENELGNKLNSARQRRHSAELQAEIAHNNQLIKEEERAKRDREQNKQKGVDASHSESPQQAIEYSKSTQSINEQIKALQYLKQARDQLTVRQAGGEEAYKRTIRELNNEINRQQEAVDKLRGKQEQLQRSKKSLMNTADQLQRKLALLFSVSAVQGYVDKLVSIRGEFEMQTRSLEILLQNKKEANNLWNQTVKLAVKSPFTVKQLTTYTKQLAAYRIENDKLFETNKMLADVSAGLGVDMQRLILAFGQVKAANFLRGTELRQFSEAGVNMLDELSHILSEVEGRVISVGDVFEMISNRQISFEHVEEVFKRITAPGGLFYQMQEKQSETTKGMMLNLHDSVELMMNDIGISYDGVIKGGINALKTLVDNWRTIAPILKTVVLSFGFNLIRKGILSLGPIFSTAGTAVAGFFKTFKTAMLGAQMQMATGTSAVKAYAGVLRSLSSISFSGWLSIITIMGMVVTAIYQAVTATSKLEEELNRIDQDLSKQLTDNIALYKELADKVNDVTASEYDRNQALDEMKRAFKDILPDEMLRAETIASYGENYKEAEKAMRSYYNSEKLMQQEEAIEKETLGDIGGKVENLSKRLSNTIAIKYDGPQEKEVAKRYKDGISRIINEIVKDVKNGKISASANEMQKELTNRLVTYVNIPKANDALKKAINEQIWGSSDIWEELFDVSAPLKEYTEKVANIQPLLGATWDDEQFEKKAAQIQQQVELVKQAYSTISNLASQKASGKVDYWREILPNIQQALTEVQQNAPIYYEALNNVWKELEKNANKGVFEFNSSIQKLGDGFNETIAGIIEKQNKGNAAAINFAEGLKEALDDKQLSQSGQAVVQIFEEVAASMELDPYVFAKFIPTAQQSLADIRTMIEGEISNIQDQIRRMNTSMASGVSGVLMNWLFFLKEGETPEQKIAKLNKLLKAYDTALSKLGGSKSAPKTKTPKAKKDKIPKTTTKKTDDPAEALADYLEEAYDRFLEFNEEMSETAANNKIFEIYGKEFETLEEKVKGLDLKLPLFKQGDEKPYLDALDKIKEKARTETKKQITDDARDATADTFLENKKEENEATKEQVDLLFEEYEIYKELEKIGMSPAMAKGLFGISTTSLNDITQKLQELKNAGKFEGTNMAEAYEEYSQKIKDEETKQQQDRLKIYTEYAKKSVGERAKIELEYLNHMAEIEKATVGRGTEKDSDGHLQSVYDNATAKAIEERNAALQKLEWEEFQKSDMFLMLFEDLDGASEQLMQHTLDQLKNFKEQWADMPLEDVKAITDKINDLESALINLKNPWKAIKTINQNIDSITNGKSRKQLYDEAMFAQTEMNRNNEEIAQLQVIRDLMWKGKEIAKEQIDLILAFSPAWDGTIEALDAIIFRKNNMNKGYMRTIGLARELTQQEKDAIKTYNRQEDAYNEINSLAKKLYDASKELVELFVDEDSLVTVFADMGMNMASTVLDTLALQANIDATRVSLQAAQVEAQAFGLAMNSAAGIVGWIVMGIQLLSQVLSAIFNAHDKAKQKEIDKEIENVEKLEKALEDLEERLEKVYSMGQLNSAMRQTQTNIDKQIQSYEKMIHLEEEKKKTDKDQIKDWQESIEELREKRLELHKEMVESLGGDYDIRSVARDFVDAWIDAFKETGDGLKGLRENFKEFFLNILLEQAVMKKVGGLFGDAMNYLNDVVLSDYIVTDAERKKTEGMFDAAMIKTNDYLNMLFGENGVLNKYIDDTDSTLSGLQQGVQGVTEETAQIIEAYLNSIRFFIAQDNQNLAKLTDAFTNVDTPSPILSELRNQTELITTIKDALNSVIKTGGHTEGGAYIKVAL